MGRTDWCPFSQKACRDDCAWAVVWTSLNSDGVDRGWCCSLYRIALWLIERDDDD